MDTSCDTVYIILNELYIKVTHYSIKQKKSGFCFVKYQLKLSIIVLCYTLSLTREAVLWHK